MALIDANCPICGGEGWVCENHRDLPWGASGDAQTCGAGPRCPARGRPASHMPLPAFQAVAL
jgi:hypothetical protein